MSSVSAAHLIMFIGSLVIASAVAGTVIMEVGNVSDSIEMRGSSVAEGIETDIAIISDESQADAMVTAPEGDDDVYEITVLVKNIGSGDIPAQQSAVDALVDGTYSPVTNVERIDYDSNTWDAGAVVELTIETHQVSGDTDVAVLVTGSEDTITFYWDEEDD